MTNEKYTVVDQNARKNSIFVDFFGQKAATTRVVATLSLKTGDLERDILNLTHSIFS